MARKAARGGSGKNPDVEFQRAVGLFEAGKFNKAAKIAKGLAKQFPQVSDILQLQGLIALQSGNAKNGVVFLERALSALPGDAGLLNNLGNALKGAGRNEDASDAFRKSLDARPGHPETLANLGGVLADLGEFEDAKMILSEAIKLAPEFTDVRVNLSFVLIELREFEQAVDCCLKALEKTADHAHTLNNLGRAYLALGRNAEAEEVIKKALAADPDHIGALQAMGILHFLHARWSEAWACYELRWHIKTTRHRDFPQPAWAGEPVAGKTLLVWGEQGVGDEILFSSMVTDLIEQGASLLLELDPRLVALYQRSFPGVTCIPREFPPVKEVRGKDIDFQAAAGSLGRWLRPDEASFPKRSSFLVADTEKAESLRQRYRGDGDDLLVGISWSSANRDMGDEKSLAIMELAPLARISGIRLVDLQYGDSDRDRGQFEAETGVLVIRDKEIDSLVDLDGFAAQVAAMDLVVSISNTTVHMAGALGVPVWVLLPNAPMWRWLADRDNSPWYSSVRLFRQTERGQWAGVIDEVMAAFKDFSPKR